MGYWEASSSQYTNAIMPRIQTGGRYLEEVLIWVWKAGPDIDKQGVSNCIVDIFFSFYY